VTIEGLNQSSLSPLQRALVEEGATQCGFCTPGIVVGLTAFALGSPILDEEEALAAIEGNLCRCTGYVSVARAARRVAAHIGQELPPPGRRISALVQAGVLPAYFLEIPMLLGTVAVRSEAPAGVSPEAVVVAGGSDLFVQRASELRRSQLRLLTHEPDLSGIRMDDDGLRLGSMTATEDWLRSRESADFVPGLAGALRLVSSQLIRNQATVGGNIANASPAGDLTVILLALDARVELRGPGGERTMPLRDFFKGYKEYDLLPGEIIVAVRIPADRRGTRFHFEKVSRRRYLDVATVNTALSLRVEYGVMRNVGLSAGGVAPVPLFLSNASRALEGLDASASVVEECANAASAEASPISDVRGSASYKRALLRQLVRAHFVELFPELGLEDALQ